MVNSTINLIRLYHAHNITMSAEESLKFYTQFSKATIESYADFCWKMTEYWFAWHTFWFNLLQDNKLNCVE
jgi:hypothetical protein